MSDKDFHTALEDLLVRELIRADRPLTIGELKYETNLTDKVILDTLEEAEGVWLNDSGHWVVEVDDRE